MLKKAISASRRVAALETDTSRMLYTWLISWLDIEGRFSGDLLVIKGSVAPRLRHITEEVIEECLQDMVRNELIILYKVDGDRYLQLRKFGDHQTLRREKEAESKIPGPDQVGSGPGVVRDKVGTSPSQEKLREVKRREEKSTVRDQIQESLEEPVDKLMGQIEDQKKKYRCWIREPTDPDKTRIAKMIKKSLGIKQLGTKELNAYLSAIWHNCKKITDRWRYDRWCSEDDRKKCEKVIKICLDDLKKALDRGMVDGWTPAYFRGIMEGLVNRDGEDYFKEVRKE